MLVGSKKKKTVEKTSQAQETAPPSPETFDEYILKFIETRDFSGTATFIDFIVEELNQPKTTEISLWKGYALFHLGHYEDAIDVYKQLLTNDPDDLLLNLYISSCYYYLADYENAKKYANLGPSSDFRTRLLFHIAHKLNDEQELLQAHSQLIGTLENQLSLAAIHYMRANYQDAIEIYQRLLMQHPEFLALFVYIAMCQYKLDSFEESNESVDRYLGVNSDSAVALNLKSCDYLKLFDPDIAESQILQIQKFSSASYDFVGILVKHNVCVFHDGVDGFTIFTPLVNSLHEARYNLCILYMRESNPAEAMNLMNEQFQPLDLNENLLKASVQLSTGQVTSDTNLIEEANEVYKEVGEMDVIKDTVVGRQALATSKFIVGEYDNVLRIFNTIEDKMTDNDEFNYNKAMALASLSRWAEAERYFLLVKNQSYTKEIYYCSWLCRCYIKNKKLEQAWNLYMEATNPEDSKTLLVIIANDCYQSSEFYYAMRAYNMLTNCDEEPSYREGMISAAIGVFRNILSRKDSADKLPDVFACLEAEPAAEQVFQIIKDYLESSGMLSQLGY